jgi:hypothetical protein
MKDFWRYLEANKEKELKILEQYDHGFESWLKVEFVSYCKNVKKIPFNDLAIEIKTGIKGKKRKKQIDIRVSNGSGRYHYIEFKYVHFNFKSINKCIDSWMSDFNIMKKIPKPAEMASVLFGTGFKKLEEWKDLVKQYCDSVNCPIDDANIFGNKIKIAILNTRFND